MPGASPDKTRRALRAPASPPEGAAAPRGARIDTILSTGAWTDMSVEHTARTGADKGCRVIVPGDACSTMNADRRRASLDYAMGNVAIITTVDAVIAARSG